MITYLFISTMNTTFNATSLMRGISNSTGCLIKITGWCGFSDGEQTGIILGFILLFLVGCCCYCASVKEENSNIYR